MKTWLVRDARAHLGDVMDAALAGEPQRVARRGREAVVVVSEAEWERAREGSPTRSFEEHLRCFPLSHDEWLEVAPGPIPLRSKPLFGE
ncbi:type II toxin-antitoxin system Phd/YefM family antitoxin [Enterovirga rhinocerotis]|uniref:Antitoxin n=1 Tax=Enterovirga rhinocerotis TaxID=1339210 RepID=A0A4R7BT44_9HYPH|nr:type II toxin-antitoxin system Phd/YefM family antitoxin [Enterovirga rhinocerotis]TDR87277.1 prevent-host-death family protein [Enterovirga rhinocerotis]